MTTYAKRLPWFSAAVLACICMLPGVAWGDNLCNAPGDFPDVIVGDLHNLTRWGATGGITAFSVGTTSCNIGTCELKWIQNTNQHPIIGQSMYRLKDGRFEQIGQSWLKHGFFALSEDVCYPFPGCQTGGQCCQETNGSTLGVHCSDPYDAGLNGQQSNLGPKFEVNPSTGAYPFPATNLGQTGNAIFKRLQVHNTDLDPALNAGAHYVVEGQYITADDSAVFRHFNNASYRRVNVTGSGGNWNLQFNGNTVRQEQAINYWGAVDPSVLIKRVGAPGDGLYSMGSKATNLGNGRWHYEYALHNLNSHRAAGSFTIPLPYGANVTNVGFHDVDYHSGEPFDGTDWTVTLDDTSISWATLPMDENANANALRWGTTYNFRFDADFPPVQSLATIGLFRTGTPSSLPVVAYGPQVCDADGVCDPGETCSLCAVDCNNQSGQGGCCGDSVCNPGESTCSCTRDCGTPQLEEFVCNDGDDDDCDGAADCNDSECCPMAGCGGPDADGDGYELCDCNDGNPDAWSRPAEVENLTASVADGETVLDWDALVDPGGNQLTYEVLRSANPANFVTSTTCMPDTDASDTEMVDPAVPPAGGLWCYLVRAVNGCPGSESEGVLGRDSSNVPRGGAQCP